MFYPKTVNFFASMIQTFEKVIFQLRTVINVLRRIVVVGQRMITTPVPLREWNTKAVNCVFFTHKIKRTSSTKPSNVSVYVTDSVLKCFHSSDEVEFEK